MPLPLSPFRSVAPLGLSADLISALIVDHLQSALPRLDLLWTYYRNPMEPLPPAARAAASHAARAYRLGQERGLPARLTGLPASTGPRSPFVDDRAAARREVVIENDIAWRVHAMVDFLFAKPVRLASSAPDPALRAQIERVLDAAWEASGGMGLLQDAALLGHIYGHVDLVVRAGSDLAPAADPLDAARRIRIEIIDPTRGIPILSDHDYRTLDAYLIHVRRASSAIDPATGRPRVITLTEILSPDWRQVYEDEGAPASSSSSSPRNPKLVAEGENLVSPGRVPVVHIQNVSQPFAYPGLSEIEPLIPLQDELNTRLSDRACRVTMQSFKMYLAKGVDGFDQFPVGPGQVWSTDNPDAQISAFGGDAASPSEDAHIDQIREAMDKTSAVPPLATGVVQARVGNLSSENALRLTLSGLLARTQRKRLLYGRGIEDASRLVLSALDAAGILRTSEADRAVKAQWSDPLPDSELSALQAAKAKQDLGVPNPQVLAELGYGPAETGIG